MHLLLLLFLTSFVYICRCCAGCAGAAVHEHEGRERVVGGRAAIGQGVREEGQGAAGGEREIPQTAGGRAQETPDAHRRRNGRLRRATHAALHQEDQDRDGHLSGEFSVFGLEFFLFVSCNRLKKIG